MAGTKDILLEKLRSGQDLRRRDQIKLTLYLALPAILGQLSMILMSYIDAGMVGRLGSDSAAAIGLVSTVTWLLGGFCYANTSGFGVQVAHRIGAKDYAGARKVLREGILTVLVISGVLSLISISISKSLPVWLGGGEQIIEEAGYYILIYSLFLPTFQLATLGESFLQASGNMKIPSIAGVGMCVLDVIFNYLLIFVFDLGVKGAAIGTGLAEICAAIFAWYYIIFRSKELSIIGEKESFIPQKKTLSNAYGISGPLWLQNIISRGAYIAGTVIIAPLGTIAIAANSFAITAESFCYLPGYGVSDAATSLVGQSLGAGRKPLAQRFAWITIGIAASIMAFLAVLMYIFAPELMGMLSVDPEVIDLGAQCLRIEAYAEALYGVGIVAYGCCVGAGDTLVPSAINLVSMWAIRIALAFILVPQIGLLGYWIAMALELSVKGLIFIVRIARGRWMKKEF